MPLITHEQPNNWKALELMVAGILQEIGFNPVIRQKRIDLVRGYVNADVYAEDNTQTPKIIYLCECKHWSSKVPKTVIHSFRTVMQDFGANYGFIISEKGFQKGAIDAARNTNVDLVDWSKFQNIFFPRWLKCYSKEVVNELDELIQYTEPILGSALVRKLDSVTKDRTTRINRFKELRQEYMPIGTAVLALYGFLRFPNLFNEGVPPLRLNLSMDLEHANWIEFKSYKEYMDYLKNKGKEGLEKIEYVLNEANFRY
jgi:hypothetical protein